jgi:hypothetical protein
MLSELSVFAVEAFGHSSVSERQTLPHLNADI